MYVQIIIWILLCYITSISVASTSFPIPTGGHHLLLQHSPIAVALPPVARRQMEIMPSLTSDREPTCSELRSMWRHMRRMGRQMEFTNEIPKMQDPFTASAVRYAGGRRRPSKYPDPNPYSAAKSSIANKELVFHSKMNPFDYSKNHFGDVVKEQNEVTYPVQSKLVNNNQDSLGFHEFDDYRGTVGSSTGSGRVPGRFSDGPLPEESLGLYGTVVHSPEERAMFRARTRRPPDYIFNRYRTAWSDGAGRVPFRAVKPQSQYHYGREVTHGERHPMGGFVEYPQEVRQRGSGGPRVERIDKIALPGKLKNTCLRYQNKTCKTDVDCFCNGNPKMFCGDDRCRPLFKATKYGKQKYGKSYLKDPYQRTLVGYSPKSDPVWPGPF